MSCGLFFAYEPAKNMLALWLRIPALELAPDASGTLEIQSGLGHRTYQAAELHVARLVRLAPQSPLASCRASGELLALSAHLSSQVAAFDPDVNFFHASEKGGRFIFGDESLEWGLRYRVLSRSALQPPPDIQELMDWSVGPLFGDWRTYDLSLPAVFPASRSEALGLISAFLGRRIRPGRPRVYVVHPMPHHIDVDGTLVFSTPPESLILRRTAPGAVTVPMPKAAPAASVADLSDEWVQVSGLRLEGQECTIAIGGAEQVLLRHEACGLFRPPGIQVSTGETNWDLCSGPLVLAEELRHAEVLIECGNVRVAAHLARMNDGWVQRESSLCSTRGTVRNFDAGSFGQLRAVHQPQAMANQASTVSASGFDGRLERAKWLEGVVTSRFGRDGWRRVLLLLQEPGSSNLSRLGPILTSPLMPYIRAALGKRHIQRV